MNLFIKFICHLFHQRQLSIKSESKLMPKVYLPSFPHTNHNVLCFPKAQAAYHRLKLATVYSSHHNGNWWYDDHPSSRRDSLVAREKQDTHPEVATGSISSECLYLKHSLFIALSFILNPYRNIMCWKSGVNYKLLTGSFLL